MIRHRTYDGIVIWLGVAKIWKQPFDYIFTQRPSELCSHTPVQSKFGASATPPRRPPKPRGYAEKSKLSCWELAYCKAQHITTPTRNHGISKNWVLVYNIITSVIAVRDSPVSKFTQKKNAFLKAPYKYHSSAIESLYYTWRGKIND